jgi:hypothetical protein
VKPAVDEDRNERMPRATLIIDGSGLFMNNEEEGDLSFDISKRSYVRGVSQINTSVFV